MFGLTDKGEVSGRSSRFGGYFPAWMDEMFFGQPIAGQITLEDALNSPNANDAKRKRVVDVILPESFLLSRTLLSPPRARANWQSFAKLDLIRQTPFKPDQVYWALTQNEKSTDVELIQWIAKRTEVETAAKRLEARGLVPRRFLFRTEHSLEVLTDQLGENSTWRRRLVALNMLLIGVFVFSSTFAWLSLAWEAKAQADILELEVQDLQQQALSLRSDLDSVREIDGSAADLVLLISEKTSRWSPGLAGAVSRTPDGKERFEIDIAIGRSVN